MCVGVSSGQEEECQPFSLRFADMRNDSGQDSGKRIRKETSPDVNVRLVGDVSSLSVL